MKQNKTSHIKSVSMCIKQTTGTVINDVVTWHLYEGPYMPSLCFFESSRYLVLDVGNEALFQALTKNGNSRYRALW